MAKRNIGNEIIDAMQDAVGYMRGKKPRVVVNKIEIPDHIDVKKIRKNLHLSRQEFADRFGFSARTLQHWEQGNRRPHGSARVLLLLLQKDPVAIETILYKKTVPANKKHLARKTL